MQFETITSSPQAHLLDREYADLKREKTVQEAESAIADMNLIDLEEDESPSLLDDRAALLSLVTMGKSGETQKLVLSLAMDALNHGPTRKDWSWNHSAPHHATAKARSPDENRVRFSPPKRAYSVETLETLQVDADEAAKPRGAGVSEAPSIRSSTSPQSNGNTSTKQSIKRTVSSPSEAVSAADGNADQQDPGHMERLEQLEATVQEILNDQRPVPNQGPTDESRIMQLERTISELQSQVRQPKTASEK